MSGLDSTPSSIQFPNAFIVFNGKEDNSEITVENDYMQKVNGTFVRTVEEMSGLPVYSQLESEDMCSWYGYRTDRPTGWRWLIGRKTDMEEGTNRGHACTAMIGVSHPATPGVAWSIRGKGAGLITQSTAVVRDASEAEVVRSCSLLTLSFLSFFSSPSSLSPVAVCCMECFKV
jgi:hypothetical protein